MFRPRYEIVNQVFNKLYFQKISRPTQNSFKPIVTIARDAGSGGRPIAKQVAKKLRFTYYDKQLIDEIAKSSRRRKSIIKRVDEKTRSAIQDIVQNLINPEYISDLTYINHLTSVILSISNGGKAVILGHGANFIVPREHTLSALITAPKSTRIARAVEFEHISLGEARKRVTKITRERHDFVSQYFHKRYTSTSYYDLILNTEFFSIDQATECVIHAFKKKFPTFQQIVSKTLSKTGKLYP